MFLALLAVTVAIGGGLGPVSPRASGASRQPVAESRAGYLRPPVVLATVPGVLVRYEPEAEPTASVPEPTPTPEAAPQPTPEPTPEPRPAFLTYIIQEGDTVSSIAARFGLDPQYILWNNPEVRDDPDLLVVGEEVLIPGIDGLVYHVKLGDTLSDVAAAFQIDVQSIVDTNGLSSADSVIEGMALLLPGAVPPPPPPPIVAVAAAAPVTPPPAPQPLPAPQPPAPAPSAGYIWPWYGNITQYFGGYHRGIDIDGFGNYGAAVVAAASGQVVLVKWDTYGYGYHVIIRHDDGSETLYSHFSDIYVTQGQYVAQGEAVGGLGCTGYCTGTHLHFEIRIGGVPVDPLAYLP